MITLTTRRKAQAQNSKSAKAPGFTNNKHPEAVPENFKTNAAWIDNRYKLYMPKPKKNQDQQPELYDLEKDREENNNIASRHPKIVKAMQAELLEWQKSVEHSLTGADY